MEKKHIPIITLAVFSISLLFMFSFITNPAFASASANDFAFGTSNQIVFYMSSLDQYVILQKAINSESALLYTIDGDSETPDDDVVSAFSTIRPQQKGCTISTGSNPCNADNGSATCRPNLFGSECEDKTGINGDFKALWCGLTECFILFDYTSGTWSSQLLRVCMIECQSGTTGIVNGYMNITNTFTLGSALWGYDESTGGIGGITLFWAYHNGGATTNHLVRTGGTSLMGNVDDDDLVISNGYPVTSITGCRNCGGSSTVTRIFTLAENEDGAGANRMGALFNLNTGAISLSITPNKLSTDCPAISSATDSVFTGIYLGDTQNSFLLAGEGGFYEYNIDAVFQSCFDATTIPIVNYVRGFAVDEDDSVYYIYHGSGSALASVTKMNLVTPSSTSNFDSSVGHTISSWVDGGQPYYSIATATSSSASDDFNTVLLTSDSVRARMIYPDGFESGGGGSSDGQTDGICNNGTLLDCIGGNANANALEGLTANINATTIGNNLGQGIGIIDPDNDDVKTNGVGLLFMLGTGTFFASALAVTIAELNKKGWVNMSVKEIDPIFWLFLVVGVVSLSFYLQWIPDLVFYGMMTGIAGLVTIGILKHTGKM